MSRFGTLLALLLVAAPAAQAQSTWKGHFTSNSQQKEIDVVVTMAADKSATVSFETLSCTVTMKPSASGDATAFDVSAPEGGATGYCNAWVGGTATLTDRPDGWKRIRIANKSYAIEFNLMQQ